MELTLWPIDSRPLTLELDDVVAGLLAARLNLPSNTDTRAALAAIWRCRRPWMLDEIMRKRIMRRLILDIADPALVIRYLMIEQPH